MSDFTMPSLGADMDSGTLLEWLVAPGDTVRRGQPVAVVDTDKAAIEIESFFDGVIDGFLVEPGQRVAVGTTLATIARPGADQAAPPEAAPPEAAPPEAAPHPPQREAVATVPEQRRRRASPPVRHHAAEIGVDLATVTGTGAHGAVTRADVDRAATRRPPRASPYARRLAAKLGVDVSGLPTSPRDDAVHAAQVLAAASPRPEGRAEKPAEKTARKAVPPRTTIAALMTRAKREIPHYYVATTVDLHPVVEWLREGNRERPVTERIVPAAVLLKATALAARRSPALNGFWQDDHFVPGEDVHLGVAITVRGGALVAPAIEHTADLDVPTVMARLRDLVLRARHGRLTRAELAAPTLTVTDLGDQGVEEVIGVIYPPQVALLGVGRIVERPWAVDGLLAVRPVVRLTLSGDHRATDGYTGARFLAVLEDLLRRPDEL